MRDLEGRVAVVTGGASGIGYAMAERFAGEGRKVVLADVQSDALEESEGRLRAAAVAGQVVTAIWEPRIHVPSHPEMAGVTARHEDILSGGPPRANLG